jgi:hypothetical protein
MSIKINSSSTIRLSLLGLFLPPGYHLPISFVVFIYFFSLQVWNLNFLGSLLSSILCICSLQCILYCVNLSVILKMSNCSLMSILLFCRQVYILPLVLIISFLINYFSLFSIMMSGFFFWLYFQKILMPTV